MPAVAMLPSPPRQRQASDLEDERKGIAKRQAINYCNEVFEYMSTRGRDFFMEVKQELEKL